MTAANHCAQWGILYLAWVKAAPDVRESKKQAYIEHLRTCPVCKAVRVEFAQLSMKAVHPDMEAER